MAEELSVEEAFGAFEKMGAKSHGRGWWQRWVSTGLWRVEDAARALALATLEEAENSGCIYPGCDHPCTSCPIDKLRARIEKLGR